MGWIGKIPIQSMPSTRATQTSVETCASNRPWPAEPVSGWQVGQTVKVGQCIFRVEVYILHYWHITKYKLLHRKKCVVLQKGEHRVSSKLAIPGHNSNLMLLGYKNEVARLVCNRLQDRRVSTEWTPNACQLRSVIVVIRARWKMWSGAEIRWACGVSGCLDGAPFIFRCFFRFKHLSSLFCHVCLLTLMSCEHQFVIGVGM